MQGADFATLAYAVKPKCRNLALIENGAPVSRDAVLRYVTKRTRVRYFFSAAIAACAADRRAIGTRYGLHET